MAHGGMLSAAEALFPDAPRPFLDLSTGINPVPYPLAAPAAMASTRLPDAADLDALQRVAAIAYGAASPDEVVAFPGTQMLISLLPHLLAHPGARVGARVGVRVPTYHEHAASWREAGYDVVETADVAALAACDIAVLCNPNNPDGATHGGAALLRLAGQVNLLVVDEAFADLEPQVDSLAGSLSHPSVIALRSFGKTYGLAGLRLGFALTNPDRAARLRRAIGPWAISGAALAAGLQALPDQPWRARSIARLDADAARLDAMLAAHGLAFLGGTRLFRLYRHTDATVLWHELGARGILTRRFTDQPEWLRFGLPGQESEWARLSLALADCA
jgi:cobalamin biosynthetic protein CobC